MQNDTQRVHTDRERKTERGTMRAEHTKTSHIFPDWESVMGMKRRDEHQTEMSMGEG